MKELYIKYPNGQMVIHVHRFFPCTQKRAKKLFSLIKQYCTDQAKEELCVHLFLLREYYRMQVETFGQDRGNVPADWDPGGDPPGNQRERKSLRRKAMANYLLFCEMEVDDAWMS